MTTSVTRLCFATQHKTCKTKTKTKIDFLVSDRYCPKTDGSQTTSLPSTHYSTSFRRRDLQSGCWISLDPLSLIMMKTMLPLCQTSVDGMYRAYAWRRVVKRTCLFVCLSVCLCARANHDLYLAEYPTVRFVEGERTDTETTNCLYKSGDPVPCRSRWVSHDCYIRLY